MSEQFSVDRAALGQAAGRYTTCTNEMAAASSKLVDPDPIMFGLLTGGLFAPAGVLLTNKARDIIQGLGGLNQALGDNLNGTKSLYDAVEAENEAKAATMLGGN